MKKEVFKQGTFLYNITYKVKKDRVSFAKVFWWGLLIKFIIGMVKQTFPNPVTIAIDLGYLIGWMQSMWYSRNNVKNKIWFFIGFGLPIVLTVLYLLYV